VRAERLSRDMGFDLRWIAFPLHPETPQEGRRLADLFAGRLDMLDRMKQHLKMRAEQLGVEMSDRTMTWNSRAASELAVWAEKMGRGWEFHQAVYRAVFVDGRNIAEIPVLEELAGAAGLPSDQVRDILQDRRHAKQIDEEWELCQRLGITAVPTFDNGRERLTGYVDDDMFEQFCRQAINGK